MIEAISAFVCFVLLAGLCVVIATEVGKLKEWKRQIEGKTEFGDWLLVSKQEWDDFRKYFYTFEWDVQQRLQKLESRGPVNRRAILPNKWKPWAR